MTPDPDVEIVAQALSFGVMLDEGPLEIATRILSALRERGYVKIKPLTSEELGELYKQQFALGSAPADGGGAMRAYFHGLILSCAASAITYSVLSWLS